MADKNQFQIMLVAGEPSGDLHAADLLQELNLRESRSELNFTSYGMGGERMRQQGFTSIVGIEQMAVMGIVEILKHFPTLYRVLQQMRALLKTRRPDLLILVDYPGFNLLLAKSAKKLGIKVLYYISPKVWVWREGRVNKLAKWVDHIALIFPFELPYFQRVGLAATYVGNPLVRQIETTASRTESIAESRTKLTLDPYKITVGLFPGSRKAEVEQLLPTLLESAELIYTQNSSLQFILSQAEELPIEMFELAKYSALPIQIVKGDSHRAMRSCSAVVTASGTITLELALLDIPMVVIYKISALSYAIIRRLINTEHISLVNIVEGSEVVVELLQENVNAERVVKELNKIVPGGGIIGKNRDEMLLGLQRVKSKLGDGESTQRLADLVGSMLNE